MPRRPIDADRALREVGRRIAELRGAADLTQEQLATRAGIGWKYQQQIELGYENLTLKTLVKYANLLGVALADLMQAPASRTARPGRPSRPNKRPSATAKPRAFR
jgi:transcriptional regulator with XRE-family HTH domain